MVLVLIRPCCRGIQSIVVLRLKLPSNGQVREYQEGSSLRWLATIIEPALHHVRVLNSRLMDLIERYLFCSNRMNHSLQRERET